MQPFNNIKLTTKDLKKIAKNIGVKVPPNATKKQIQKLLNKELNSLE